MEANKSVEEDVIDLGFGKGGAGKYDRYSRLLPNRREKTFWKNIISNVILNINGHRVLDVGVGTGFLSGIALELGLQVVGLDLSPNMLEMATKNLKGYGPKFIPILGNAQNLQFEDESFDIVMSRAVLWTMPNPGRMLKETLRVLKPDGTLLLSDGTFKHLGTPIEKFSNIVHFILDVIVGWNWPGRNRAHTRSASSLPKFPQKRVVQELRSLEATVIQTYDLKGYQDLIYRIMGLYWYPYLLVVKC